MGLTAQFRLEYITFIVLTRTVWWRDLLLYPHRDHDHRYKEGTGKVWVRPTVDVSTEFANAKRRHDHILPKGLRLRPVSLFRWAAD